MRQSIVASAIIFAFLCGCGSETSGGSLQSIGVENFDRMMAACLIDAGITDNPLENVSLKYNNNPVYREKFESCVIGIVPDDADMILSDHMEYLQELPEQDNIRLLDAMSCVENKYGLDFGGTITYREDRWVDFDALLRSFQTDIEAFEYWNHLEQCGWYAAPDIDSAKFALERECLTHEHDGESLHSHGDC